MGKLSILFFEYGVNLRRANVCAVDISWLYMEIKGKTILNTAKPKIHSKPSKSPHKLGRPDAAILRNIINISQNIGTISVPIV